MSLINYVEPVNAGSLFLGFGGLFLFLVIGFVILKFCKPYWKWVEHYLHKDMKYSIIEEKMLYDIAKEKGIDLDSEILKREILSKPRKSFRTKIEEKVFEKMFPEEDNK